MSREFRTAEDLRKGKISAIKKALKEANAFLPDKMISIITKYIEDRLYLDGYYEFEVVTDAITALSKLMLELGETRWPNGTLSIFETGDDIFGAVQFGRAYIQAIDGEMSVSIHQKDKFQTYFVDRESPFFETEYPFAVYVERGAFLKNDEEYYQVYEHSSEKIIIYAPPYEFYSGRLSI